MVVSKLKHIETTQICVGKLNMPFYIISHCNTSCCSSIALVDNMYNVLLSFTFFFSCLRDPVIRHSTIKFPSCVHLMHGKINKCKQYTYNEVWTSAILGYFTHTHTCTHTYTLRKTQITRKRNKVIKALFRWIDESVKTAMKYYLHLSKNDRENKEMWL